MENEVSEPVPKYNYISAKERVGFEKYEYYQGDIFATTKFYND